VVVWLLITIIMFTEGLPFRPRTVLGWVAFLLLAPVVFVAFEAGSALVDREPIGRWVEKRTGGTRFSVARITYVLLRAIVVLGLLMLVAWILSSSPGVRRIVSAYFGPDG
jgi:hypothetical protein